jgi:hypothetical protein
MELNNNNEENLESSNPEELMTKVNENPVSGPSITSQVNTQGGTGGAGGAGGNGGQAFNITYVDNYSMLTFMYTIILMLIDQENEKQKAVADQVLPLLESIMVEQKEYRQSFLETLQALKQQQRGS